MENEEIIKLNKLIADFMGIKTKVYSDTPTITQWNFNNSMLRENEMKYNESWDWIMPVVEKIEILGFDIYLCCVDGKNSFEIDQSIGGNIIDIESGISKLETAFKAVTEFIKWYNQQDPIT